MKNLYWIIILSITLWSCKDEGNVHISGSYPEGKSEYLELHILNIAQTNLIDSVKVNKKGQFKFTVELNEPELLLVKNSQQQYINLLAHPDDTINLDIPQQSFKQGYSLSGSEESEKIRELVEKLENTRSQLDSISDIYDKLTDKGGVEAGQLTTAYQEIFREQRKSNIRFIVENINSLASVYALYQRVAPDIYVLNEIRDLQYYKIVADSISVKYPGSSLTASLVNDVERRKAEYLNLTKINEYSKNNEIKTGLIDLVIENTESEEISLKSLEGNVVLLNFWASWNPESREANRNLKAVYDKYHARGFEIYSVSLDNDRNQWRSTIFFEEYPWINVSELTYPYSYAASVYNVTELPTNYLIDREGNILIKNLSGKILATWLDNLL
jgi:hypothetical protein